MINEQDQKQIDKILEASSLDRAGLSIAHLKSIATLITAVKVMKVVQNEGKLDLLFKLIGDLVMELELTKLAEHPEAQKRLADRLGVAVPNPKPQSKDELLNEVLSAVQKRKEKSQKPS